MGDNEKQSLHCYAANLVGLTMNVAGNSVTVNILASAAINSINIAPGDISFNLSRGDTTLL